MAFSFGADPEFFISNNGRLRSAIGILPNKSNAIDINGNKFYYDNALAECAIKPAYSKKEAIENIRETLFSLKGLIGDNDFLMDAAHDFPETELLTEDSRIVACNPEWCAYTLAPLDSPDYIIKETPFRTAGGHVHLGDTSGPLKDGMKIPFVIKMLDLFMGIPSVFLDKDDTSIARRKVYGKAGSHRQPDHGVEYRPLGNFWFKSPQLVELIYDVSAFTLDFVAENKHTKFWNIDEDLLDDDDPSLAYNCYGYDVEALKDSINSCDKESAAKFMLFIDNYMPYDLIRKIYDLEKLDLNFEEEWKLD